MSRNPFDDLLHPQPRPAQQVLQEDPFDDDAEASGAKQSYTMDPFFDE
jgi:hypothetical protein